MTLVINDELRAMIADKESLKILASVDMNGNPHVVAKGSIELSEDGKQLVYMELLEGSRTNKNLTAGNLV